MGELTLFDKSLEGCYKVTKAFYCSKTMMVTLYSNQYSKNDNSDSMTLTLVPNATL